MAKRCRCRVDVEDLSAATIAIRIMMLVMWPACGTANAAATLVGRTRAHGRPGAPDAAFRVRRPRAMPAQNA